MCLWLLGHSGGWGVARASRGAARGIATPTPKCQGVPQEAPCKVPRPPRRVIKLYNDIKRKPCITPPN